VKVDEFTGEGREAMETITFAPPPEVAGALELLVQRGRYRDLSEAMNEAVRLLVQREKAAQATTQILAIRRKLADWQADLTQAVVASHGEET
jgi:Arc/MetJ-type ribon-helix-helix transcriptional regulator